MKWQQTDIPVRDKIIAAAVKVAERMPLHSVTRGRIAKKADTAPSLVSYYLGTMDDMRKTIVERAVETNNLAVIGQALAAHHPGVKSVPDDIKQQALKALLA